MPPISRYQTIGLPLFLGGVSREIYSREFGLTAQALRDGGHELLNAGGRLAETLAASSASMTMLSRIREKLQLEADGLFTPRRSSGKPFYMAVDRRDDADKRLRDAIVTREAHAIIDADIRHPCAAGALKYRGRGERGPCRGDPELLRQRLDALSDIPAQADRLRHDTAALNIESGALVAEVASLDPSPGALETLRSLPVLDGASIANHARASECCESEEKRLREALDAADNAIAASEAELARLASSGSVPTRADLVGARQERDIHLDDCAPCSTEIRPRALPPVPSSSIALWCRIR